MTVVTISQSELMRFDVLYELSFLTSHKRDFTDCKRRAPAQVKLCCGAREVRLQEYYLVVRITLAAGCAALPAPLPQPPYRRDQFRERRVADRFGDA